MTLHNAFKAAAQKTRQIIHDTPIEIAIGAVLFGAVAGGVAYQVQAEREGQIPLAFSEIEKTTRHFEGQGQAVPPLTRVFSMTNEITMKVFEANNTAFKTGYSDEDFARALQKKTDPAFNDPHRLISDIAKELPGDAEKALHAIGKAVAVVNALPPAAAAFSAAWTESHDDEYHTEVYFTTVCHSNGNGGSTCSPQMNTRQVYDYTDHDYYYHPQHGAAAADLLNAFLEKHPDIGIGELLYLTTSVGNDNLNAMIDSIRENLQGKAPTEEQALAFANLWATGSNLMKYYPVIVAGHAQLLTIAPQWDAAKNTARHKSYRTYSRSHSGPAEYQIAEKAQKHMGNAQAAAKNIIDGIQFAGENAPVLDARINEFIAVALEEKHGDAGALRSEIMDLARQMYEKNFEGGLDVYPFKWGTVVLFTILGIAAGGLAGLGADRGITHYRNTRREKEESKPEAKDKSASPLPSFPEKTNDFGL